MRKPRNNKNGDKASIAVAMPGRRIRETRCGGAYFGSDSVMAEAYKPRGRKQGHDNLRACPVQPRHEPESWSSRTNRRSGGHKVIYNASTALRQCEPAPAGIYERSTRSKQI